MVTKIRKMSGGAKASELGTKSARNVGWWGELVVPEPNGLVQS